MIIILKCGKMKNINMLIPQDSLDLGVEMKKVVKRGNQWCILHCTGSDKGKIVPGSCHTDKEKTLKMHMAIMANKSLTSVFYTDNLDYQEIKSSDGKKYFVTGYISTHDKDLVNDIVTKTCMKNMLDQLLNRSIKLDLEHETIKGETNLEKEVNKTIIPIGRITEAYQDKNGIFIKAILNSAHKRFNEVWSSIENKFLDAFSIAYIPLKSVKKSIGSEMVRFLDKVNLINIAMTGNPINPNASMGEVFAKSLDILKDYEIYDGEDIKSKPKDNNIELEESKDSEDDLMKKEDKENLEVKSEAEKKDDEKIDDSEEKEESKDISKILEKIDERISKLEKKSEEDEKPEEKEESKSKDEFEQIKKDLKEVKGFMNKPQFKGIQENMKEKLKEESKSEVPKGPLDLIS